MHPTMHELAHAATPPPRQPHAHGTARRSVRARRDAMLVRLGVRTVRAGRQLVAAGSHEAPRSSGAPPDHRLAA